MIDFEALGLILQSLYKAAAETPNITIRRVIFSPRFQNKLFYTKTYGKFIKNKIKISKKKSWVEHDNHFHIDFKIPCKPLSKYHQYLSKYNSSLEHSKKLKSKNTTLSKEYSSRDVSFPNSAKQK